MRIGLRTKVAITVAGVAGLLVLFGVTVDAQPTPRPRPAVRIDAPINGATVASPIEFTGSVTGGTPPYTFDWRIPRGTPPRLTTTTTLTQSNFTATHAPGSVTIRLTVRDANRRAGTARVRVIVQAAPPVPPGPKSINSTSANRLTLPAASVPEAAPVTSATHQVLAVNDLGMHCGDLDHRKVSILPPFNVVHGQLVLKGTAQALPEILTQAGLPLPADGLYYSAASNPADPALARPAAAPIFKTNFWDTNVAGGTGNTLAFDGYAPFFPPNPPVPANFLDLLQATTTDVGFPVPDLERLYLGDGGITIDQQAMPGVLNPYVDNVRQLIPRFNVDFPFFINFPFGYTLTDDPLTVPVQNNAVNWFSAEGIAIAPFDDFGRRNPYPLMRVDAQVNGSQVASLRTVLPVSAEADCFRCHVPLAGGGTGAAACLPTDANCTNPGLNGGSGSPRGAGTRFIVASPNQDPQFNPLLPDVSREWAADVNMVRLHDAKHGTTLDTDTPPVVCQRCHYTPALDLAHFGPLGPADARANGREQVNHSTNSRVLHSFHATLTDLFPDDMPPPNDPRRFDNALRKPVINAFVLGKLNESCYQCHPGRDTKCLRGAMFNGGLVCQDCHGTMAQVGNDFSANFPNISFPNTGSADLTKRVPWASEPGCQSCHTGDAVNTNRAGIANPIVSSDGIRLLQAYSANDPLATPYVSPNSRFAEPTALNPPNPNGTHRVLYRLSTGHGGVLCEACHGSTHAEWPVLPSAGATIANDNMAPIDLQGHAGKITECGVCHGSLAAPNAPIGLDGPHGMHPVDQRWVNENAHPDFLDASPGECQACHGLQGQGTVLSAVAVNRTFAVEGRTVTLAQGRQVNCGICHGNPLR
jgi:hypothetical protein